MTLRAQLLRIAADLPKGDATRRKLLAELSKESGGLGAEAVRGIQAVLTALEDKLERSLRGPLQNEGIELEKVHLTLRGQDRAAVLSASVVVGSRYGDAWDQQRDEEMGVEPDEIDLDDFRTIVDKVIGVRGGQMFPGRLGMSYMVDIPLG